MFASKMPSCVCREEDLKAKKSLHALKCEAYILAHHGVYEDITDLIDRNISYVYDRAEVVYSCLEGDMSEEEWCVRFTVNWKCTAHSPLNALSVSVIWQALSIIWQMAGVYALNGVRAFAGTIKMKSKAALKSAF